MSSFRGVASVLQGGAPQKKMCQREGTHQIDMATSMLCFAQKKV